MARLPGKTVLEQSMMDGDSEHCMECGRTLTHDEIGLHKKMINRGAKQYLCITCLAAYYSSTEEAMQERIDHFRRQGCLLFQ